MELITLSHGSGGKLMHDLLDKVIAPALGINDILTDSAVLNLDAGHRIAFTTDSYVVSPLFFPGGNIGSLAVHGTVNDLSMVGALPKFLTVSFVIEEGFSRDMLEKITASIADAASKADVKIVTGDTKVVEKGKGDGIFINTAGIGIMPDTCALHPSKIKPGDKIIINAPIGRHGVAVMSERNGLSFDPPLLSDSAALNSLVQYMLSITRDIHAMRDPTRGGLATTLKEIANDTGYSIQIDEKNIPIDDGVKGACELFGLDPFYVANEGVLVAFVDSSVAESLVKRMRDYPLGTNAQIIGEVTEDDPKLVLLKTNVGGTRIIDMLSGEQLPRIC